jgi:hypothetical protein
MIDEGMRKPPITPVHIKETCKKEYSSAFLGMASSMEKSLQGNVIVSTEKCGGKEGSATTTPRNPDLEDKYFDDDDDWLADDFRRPT